MRKRLWGRLVPVIAALAVLNGLFWFGWWFAFAFTMWILAFIVIGVKDWVLVRRSKGAPKLMSNQYVQMAIFIIVIIVLIFIVIIPAIELLLYVIQTGRLP